MPRGTKGEKRPTDEEMKAKALDRWNNEGGAPAPAHRPKRPRDLNQWAKRMVDIATGEVEEHSNVKKAAAPRTPKRPTVPQRKVKTPD